MKSGGRKSGQAWRKEKKPQDRRTRVVQPSPSRERYTGKNNTKRGQAIRKRKRRQKRKGVLLFVVSPHDRKKEKVKKKATRNLDKPNINRGDQMGPAS